MLEPSQRPENHEQAFHHIIIWHQAVQYVSCMRTAVLDFRSKSFLSKEGFAVEERVVTSVEIPLTSVIEKNMLPSAFKSFSKSIPERAEAYVKREVLEEDRARRGPNKHKLGSRMEAGLRSKMAETPTGNEDLVVGSLVGSGHKYSWEVLYQQVKAFNMLSPMDKALVTICMLERWLRCAESELVFSTYDLEPKEALGDLYWNLKGYVTRVAVPELNNSRLSAAMADEFGSLHHEDKRVVMLANIAYWKGEAEGGLNEYLQRFYHDVHRFWSHDWSQNCGPKIKSS